MARKEHSRFLKLVVDQGTAEAQRVITDWFTDRAPDPCPDDTGLILQLDGFPGGLDRKRLRELIEHLVAGNRLEKIQIGARVYLTRCRAPDIHRDDDRERFRLEIALDLEREKHLMYKIVIVIEAVVCALILRQWALDPGFVLQLLG